MKKEVVKELEYALDLIDVLENNIDEIDLPFGEMHITDIKERINKVMITLKQEIEFDDALKGVNNTCGNPSGCDDECRKNKHCPNPDECTQPFQCHIHSWEHLEFDEDCPLCTTQGKIEIPSYFKVFLNEVIQQLFNSIQCDGDRCSCQISDEYYHLNEVSDVMNKIRNYVGK